MLLAVATLVLAATPVTVAAEEPKGAPVAESKPKHAFEWGGVYALPEGVSDLVIQPGPDASIDIALLPVPDGSPAAFDAAVAEADRVFAGRPKPVEPGEEFAPGSQFLQLRVERQSEMRFSVRTTSSGRFVLFTQHFADEFQTIFINGGRKVFPESARNFRDRFGQIVILPTAVAAFGVKTAPVATHTLTPSFSAPARVAFNAERLAHVGSAVTGRVAELPVRQGDEVKMGDTLLVLDSAELGEAQSDYLEMRTLADTAAPAVEFARSAYERAKKLLDDSQGVSLTEVQRRQSELHTASASLLNAQASLNRVANRLRLLGMGDAEIARLAERGTIAPRLAVRAPIAGRVIRRNITLGELVGPDRDALLTLADVSRLWVLVDVPEMRLGTLVVGSTARLSLAPFPGVSFDGAVSFISADLNEATRTVQVRVEVDNADGRLRPGMFARAEIRSPGVRVLAVPDAAVQTVEGKPVVFVPFPEKPDTYLKRPVTLGEAVGGMLPVLHGLREDEPIVVSGTFILKAQLGKSSAKHSH